MKVLTITMLLCSGVLSAQFGGSLSLPINTGSKKEAGTIYKKDGSTEQGIVFLPEKMNDKAIKIKNDKKTIKINGTDIDSVVIAPAEGNKKFTFIYAPVREFKLFKKEYNEKLSKPIWLNRRVKGKMSLYSAGDLLGYKKDSIKVNRGDTYFYAHRKGEDNISYIGNKSNMLVSVNENNVFRQMASIYFSNDEEMKAKIEAEKYTLKEIHKLAEDYNNRFKVAPKKKEEPKSKEQTAEKPKAPAPKPKTIIKKKK